MPEELDPAIAEDLADSALGSLPLTRANQVLCTKRQMRECMLRLAQCARSEGSSGTFEPARLNAEAGRYDEFLESTP